MTDRNPLSVLEGAPLIEKEIERICQYRSELSDPPQAFLISTDSTQNSLLAVRADFLDCGEGLSWPDMPLLGAAFNLDWGYAFVDVITASNGLVRFEQPSCRFEYSAKGDTWGYRFCPVENCEISKLINQLSDIRKRLSEPRVIASCYDAPRVVVALL